MDLDRPEEILLTPLSIIPTEGGAVLHALKSSAAGYSGFGEAYFSAVDYGAVRAWKKHQKMTMNLVVPVGRIKFVFEKAQSHGRQSGFEEVILSRENYQRITVPPGIWFGFQGLAQTGSILLNIASIEHDPAEALRADLEFLPYDWSLVE